MSTKISCPICANDRYNNQFVSCPSCESEVCHDCIVKFVKNQSGDIACMSCRHPWNRLFIFRSLPPSLVHSTIKEQRQDVLFEREKALLPATMPLVPLMNISTTLHQERINLAKEIKEMQNRIRTIDQLLYNNSQQQYRIRRNLDNGGQHQQLPQQNVQTQEASTSKTEPKETMNIVCHCPSEECRGYVMKEDHKCGLCSSEICKKCHVILAESDGDAQEHTCNKDNVASVQLIKKECKACPSCGVQSRKTEGCSQVWCMVCKSAWNWNTREIETGQVHATDYFNYMRQNNIQIPGAVGAGGAGGGECQRQHPATRIPQLKLAFPSEITREVETYVMRKYQIMSDYIYDVNRVLVPESNIDLRIEYLRKKFDEKHWKSMLHKRDKKFVFDTELHRLRSAYSTIMRDAINTFCRSQSASDITTSITNMTLIDDLMQGEYQKLAKAFMSKRKCPF